MINITTLHENDLKENIDFNDDINLRSFKDGIIDFQLIKKCELLLVLSKKGVIKILKSRYDIQNFKY